MAIVYSDTEFGRDPIPGIKEKAQKLQIPVVQEIVTKPGAVDVSSEVAKLRRAKPDFVIFHGYVLAPIPDFIKQMRESGMSATPMGTIWSMDKSTVDAMGAAAQGWMGVMPYRYSYDTEGAPTMQTLVDYIKKTRPGTNYVTLFHTHGWLVGMIFSEVIERCLKAKKPLTGPNMKAALESINDWDTGGITGLLASLKGASDRLGAGVPVQPVEQADGTGQRVDQDGMSSPGDAAPALAIENIEVVYQHSVQVLRGLSLTVPPGQIVALLGSNGAGKTTTLKAVSGLLPLEIGQLRSGTIRYRGEIINKVAPHLLPRRGHRPCARRPPCVRGPHGGGKPGRRRQRAEGPWPASPNTSHGLRLLSAAA